MFVLVIAVLWLATFFVPRFGLVSAAAWAVFASVATGGLQGPATVVRLAICATPLAVAALVTWRAAGRAPSAPARPSLRASARPSAAPAMPMTTPSARAVPAAASRSRRSPR